MAIAADAFNIVYQLFDSFQFLVLAALGLAIIFGMMGIINLAHGEFIMIGAYVTTFSARGGLPLPVAMLVGALATGLFGMAVERAVVRRFYGRPLDSIVATWAIGLILAQGTLIVLGPSVPGLSTPLGAFEVGAQSYSAYRLVLAAASVGLLFGLYLLLNATTFGLRVRATMQNPEMARALGVKTSRMYLLTFGLGSAVAGLVGGLYAPTMTIVPNFGATFIVQAFVTVIVGGADILIGTALAGAVLGAVNRLLAILFGQLSGQLGLLLMTILIVRLLPTGISGYLAGRRRG